MFIIKNATSRQRHNNTHSTVYKPGLHAFTSCYLFHHVSNIPILYYMDGSHGVEARQGHVAVARTITSLNVDSSASIDFSFAHHRCQALHPHPAAWLPCVSLCSTRLCKRVSSWSVVCACVNIENDDSFLHLPTVEKKYLRKNLH